MILLLLFVSYLIYLLRKDSDRDRRVEKSEI